MQMSGAPVNSKATFNRLIKFGLPLSSSVSKTRTILGNLTPYSYAALIASMQENTLYPSSDDPLPNMKSPFITGSVGFVSQPSP